MRIARHILLLAILLLAWPLQVALAQSPVEITVYSSPICTTCEMFATEVLPALQETFGSDLVIKTVDVATAEGMAELEAAEERLGAHSDIVPVVVVGDQLFASEDIFGLQEPLEAAIAAELAKATPPAETAPTPTVSEPTAAVAEAAPIHLAYISRTGCEQCGRTAIILELMKGEFPGLVVHEFDHVADAELVEAMGKALGLPPARRLIAPSLYVDSSALVNDEITSTRVREMLSSYAETGAPAFWEDLDTTTGRDSVIARFRQMGPFAVMLAGLIDGINPCAFATIIFFVSYLAISRRPRRELLLIGLAFTVGVFAAYFAVGLGAMQLLTLANSVRWLGYILYGAMALGCFVLAGISVHDYRLARRGQLHDMKLNLPEGMRDRIKGRIRAASGAFIGAALVSGLIVSLMELACTGQVYLPTISFVAGMPEMRTRATLYLLLYNLMFIVPLLIVLFLTVFGTSAARFQDWFTRHAAPAKLIMALLFLLLGALLVTQLLSF